MNKQYFKSCQHLDENGKCCYEPVYRKLKMFADSKVHGDKWFEVYLCKKHWKEMKNE